MLTLNDTRGALVPTDNEQKPDSRHHEQSGDSRSVSPRNRSFEPSWHPYTLSTVRVPSYPYIRALRRRNAFPITETELRLMAAAAMMGLKRMPKAGYSTPAATGIPTTL